MLTKKFKLIATMVGLVAVLAMGLAVPGATQQNPLTRQGLTQAVKNVLGSALTASEGEILNPDAATVVSPPFVTVTYVPIARESRSAQRLIEELFSGKDFDPIFLGVIFVDRHPEKYFPFPKGVFQVFLTSSGILQLVDQEGNVVQIPGRITQPPTGVDLAKMPWGPWGLTFETFLLPGEQQRERACNAPYSADGVAAAGILVVQCSVQRMCNHIKIFGITIWESCTEVVACTNGTVIIKT